MSLALKTALRLLKRGFWPVPLRELGESYSLAGEERLSKGKEPISPQWGLQKPSEAFLKAAYDKRPKGGLGIRLGPMGGLVDVEIDGMGVGDETLCQLMGGDIPETMGWDSRRGPHRLFAWDDRCLLLDNRGQPRNVIHFSGIEIRFGTDAQLQSACPPTLSEDGKPRTWHKTKTLATLPDVFFENVDDRLRALEKRRVSVAIPRLAPSGDVEQRAVSYLEKCPPAVSGANGHTTTIVTAIKVGPGFDLPEETAFRLLRDYYSPKCDPPWTEKEIWHKVEDAYENPDRGWLLNAERERPASTFSKNGKPGRETESRGHPAEVEYQKLSDEDVGLGRYDPRTIKNIRWVIPGLVQVGGMTVLSGDGGIGKSQIAIALAASLTSDLALPSCAPPVGTGTVLIMTAEDKDEDVVIPRLLAAGADVSLCRPLKPKVLRMVDGVRKIYPRSFQDLDWWEDVAQRCADLRLVIADTIPSYLGRGVNDNVNIEVRQVLEPFVELLGDFGAGFLGICHNNKSNDSPNPVHRISGSMAYGNFARVVISAYGDPEVPGRYYMLTHKGNNLPGDQKIARAYTIESRVVVCEETGEVIDTSVVRFEAEPVVITAGQIKAAEARVAKRGPDATKIPDLVPRLRAYLEGKPGPQMVGAIMSHFGELGLIGTRNDQGRWSNGRLLYDVKAAILDIIETSKPRPTGGKPILFWELGMDHRSGGATKGGGTDSASQRGGDPKIEDFTW